MKNLVAKSMNIGAHIVNSQTRCFLIAEIGQAHDGSLGMAHAYIDTASEVGADAVKFQTHIADAESTLDEPFRVKFSFQDATRYDYWKRMEFTFEQWKGLKEHADEKGMVFISSPFSNQAVSMLDKLGVPAWKIGSGETNSGDILNAVMDTGKPILLSTGMSKWKEIDMLVDRFRSRNLPFAIFQCTSKYPVSFAEVGMNIVRDMQSRYACLVGLSDHSGTAYPSLYALARNVNFIEVHLVFDKRMFGPDSTSSLLPEEFRILSQARDAFYEMVTNSVDKDMLADSLSHMRRLFSKSLAPVRDLPRGTILTEAMLVAKKPGTGIPANKAPEIVGRKLVRDVKSNTLLRQEDFIE